MTTVAMHSMSHQPLYVQIKETLKKRILDGVYQPHDRLPSENEMMNAFSVSRITVRQALRDLYTEGLVFSAQGKGTFVSKPKAVQDVQRLEGLGEAMTPKGYQASARMLEIAECRPAKKVQEALQLQKGEDVIQVKRLRYLSQSPVSVDTSYFPLSIGRKLLGRDLTGDIFPMLENQLHIALGKADIRLEARKADNDTAKLLGIESGEAIMWVTRLTYDTQNNPIDFEYLAFRGDTYQYHFTVDRQKERER
ncbi:GntR family transcriptional regulator [Ketobacter sp. MCCC 1A13808]|uniref:GntR family transcriptional regulator n=1 Tax=Ketobacter sp. MCCC 1A13808 TaxID=2602738 RepID=UPI000F0ED5AF|nr:GntR family transcriptional regulator [Ketobacter sp. MCCC 1A13808]MVF14297.1 GntR family transcriptional regulator [Ketobacter sp. MCCC 1A13808]RLP53547.1 MAG: GntR family transcriptional regulator [Ketobacter sp.]